MGRHPQAFKTHFHIAHSDNLHGEDMAEQFKAGDVVKLKSGGPKMTVTVVGDHFGTAKVWCSWFDGTKKLDGDFSPEALELS